MNFSIEQIPAEATLRLRRDVLYPGAAASSVVLPEDQAGLHYGLFYEGKLAGVVSLFQSNNGSSSWQFRKLAVTPELQGKGFGSALLRHVLEEVIRLRGEHIWCNARSTATGFYNRYGFRPEGGFFEKGGIRYVVMAKAVQSV